MSQGMQDNSWHLGKRNCTPKGGDGYIHIPTGCHPPMMINVRANQFQSDASCFSEIDTPHEATKNLIILFGELAYQCATFIPAKKDEVDSVDELFEEDSSPSVEMIMETVILTDATGYGKVTDYTFYLIIRKAEIDPNRIFKKMILDGEDEKRPFKCQADLLSLLISYSRVDSEDRDAKAVGTLMDNPSCPVSATSLFSKFNLIMARSNESTDMTRSTFLNQVGHSFQLPRPEFSYNISTRDFRKIHLKSLPEYQAHMAFATFNLIHKIYEEEDKKKKKEALDDFTEEQYARRLLLAQSLAESTSETIPEYDGIHYDDIPSQRISDYNGQPFGGIYTRIGLQAAEYRRCVFDLLDEYLKTHTLKNPELVRRKLDIVIKDFAAESVMRFCRGAYSGVLSPVGAKIQTAIREENLYGDRFQNMKSDVLSSFYANNHVQFIKGLSNFFHVSRFHRHIVLSNDFAMDAYILDNGRVHFNLFMSGEQGGTGKSHSLKINSLKLMISGTMIEVTYSTEKAKAGEDINENNWTFLYDELPTNWFNPNDTSEANRFFKQVSSSSTMNANFLKINPDTHERSTQFIISEWTCSLQGSTNKADVWKQMTTPVLRRGFWIIDDERIDSSNSAIDFFLASSTDNQKMYDEQKDFARRAHIRQALFFDTVTLLKAGGLSPISHGVARYMITYVSRYIMEHEYGLPTLWQAQMILSYVDIQVIRDAIDSTFLNQGCPHPLDRPITIKDLRKLDPKLVACIRHVVWALGMLDLFIDPFERSIRIALRELIEKQYETSYRTIRGSDTTDPTYYYIPMGTDALSETLKQIMMVDLSMKEGDVFDETRHIPTVPSAARISFSLKNFLDRSITADSYTLEKRGHNVHINPRNRRGPMKCMEYHRIGKTSQVYYVHREWIEKIPPTWKQIIADAILEMLNHEGQHPERCVFGVDEFNPGQVQILEIPAPMAPAGKKLDTLIIPFTEMNTKDDQEELRKFGYRAEFDTQKANEVIRIPLDLVGQIERNRTLHITHVGVDPTILRVPVPETPEGETAHFFGVPLSAYTISDHPSIQDIFRLWDETPEDTLRVTPLCPDLEDMDFNPQDFYIPPEKKYHWELFANAKINRRETTFQQFMEIHTQYRNTFFRCSDENLSPAQKTMIDAHNASVYKMSCYTVDTVDHLYYHRFPISKRDAKASSFGNVFNSASLEGRRTLAKTGNIPVNRRMPPNARTSRKRKCAEITCDAEVLKHLDDVLVAGGTYGEDGRFISGAVDHFQSIGIEGYH